MAFHPLDQWVLVSFLKLTIFRDSGCDSHYLIHRLYTRLKNLPPMTMYLRDGLLCLLRNSDNIGSTRNKMFMSEKNGIINKIIKRKGKDFKTLVCFSCTLSNPFENIMITKVGGIRAGLQRFLGVQSFIHKIYFNLCEELWLFPKLMGKGCSCSNESRDIRLLCALSHFVLIYDVCCICSRRKSSREAKKNAVSKVTPFWRIPTTDL